MTSDQQDTNRQDEDGAADGVSDGAGVDPVEQAESGTPEVINAKSDGEGEVGALKDRYLRLAAEFDNYRKRTAREQSGSRDRAQAEVLESLLEPLDDLSRVADYDEDGTTVTALLEGVQMVERKIFRALENLGLEPLDAEGKVFDPAVHEALMTAPAESEEEDETVGQVFQTGYQFKGMLVRPARVQVRKYDG